MRVLTRTVALALACAGCPGEEPCAPGWKELLDRTTIGRPLLSIWGRGDDVFLVGGGVMASPERNGVLLRWDGAAWETRELGRGQTLWWIWGPDGPGDVWMVGDRGLALRWDGVAVSEVQTGTTATLFGVWGSGPADVWLVGGSPGGGAERPNDLVLRHDGQGFRRDEPPARGAAFFKVWGSGPDDVWIVGEGGVIWQRTPAGWVSHDSGTRDSLTTVHGCGPDEVYAVGGQTVLRYDGTSWSQLPVQPLSTAVGVHCGPDQVLVVGNGGLKMRYVRAADAWLYESLAPPFFADFHAAWIAPSGALWAAGGNFNAPPTAPRVGMIGFHGCPAPR
jgi:hypothetical protein